MAIAEPYHDIKILIKSRYGLLQLLTTDEPQASNLLRDVAARLGLPYYLWSSSQGLRRDGNSGAVYDSNSLAKALQNIKASRQSGIYYLENLSLVWEDATILPLLKDAVEDMASRQGALVFMGINQSIPEILKPFLAQVDLPTPTIDQYKRMVFDLLQELNSRLKIEVALTKEEGQMLLNSLKGLTLFEAKKIVTRVIVDDNRLDMDDLPRILEAKKQLLTRDSMLEFTAAGNNLSDVADLKGLKSWLAKRKQIIFNPDQAREFGLTFPRGILLLGVQGCGKSFCAKAISKEWGLPLLKLDPSNMYSKWAGESELNFRKAMITAEKMAPVVLWIDEIEKGFSVGSDDTDGGTSKRIFGTFLAWMQDRKADVFIVATANNIDHLAPEFLRKGRFDEIFFVDLPDEETRKAVFDIHLKKRKREPADFDLTLLAQATEGFSPAEIEQTIVSGLYSAFSTQSTLTTDMLLTEIKSTKPLSETMHEKVQALRDWASTRTVPAN